MKLDNKFFTPEKHKIPLLFLLVLLPRNSTRRELLSRWATRGNNLFFSFFLTPSLSIETTPKHPPDFYFSFWFLVFCHETTRLAGEFRWDPTEASPLTTTNNSNSGQLSLSFPSFLCESPPETHPLWSTSTVEAPIDDSRSSVPFPDLLKTMILLSISCIRSLLDQMGYITSCCSFTC